MKSLKDLKLNQLVGVIFVLLAVTAAKVTFQPSKLKRENLENEAKKLRAGILDKAGLGSTKNVPSLSWTNLSTASFKDIPKIQAELKAATESEDSKSGSGDFW